MTNETLSQPAIHSLIANRWSPREFDSRTVPSKELASLFEAARWAPSSFNEQPWRFIVATKDQPAEYAKLLSVLVPFNQNWAQSAPVLALGVAKKTFSRNGHANGSALHDLGQATANLTLEATARGISVHQMAGILPDKARELYHIPGDYEVATAFALGYLEPAAAPPTRERKPLESFVFSGDWERPATLHN